MNLIILAVGGYIIYSLFLKPRELASPPHKPGHTYTPPPSPTPVSPQESTADKLKRYEHEMNQGLVKEVGSTVRDWGSKLLEGLMPKK